MTLILGIKCQEGIVLGADGAATLGALGQQTVRQLTKKLEIITDCVVVGVSGPVGLHQRFADEVRGLWENRAFVGRGAAEPAPSSAAAMVKISEALRKHILPEMQAAAASGQVTGQGIALQSAISQSIVALPVGRSACLFQFDHQGSPEEATDQLPFVSIGSGQRIADPFLAFVRKMFWKKGCPSINAGIFATLWTLQHAIETNPGGISDPKQIVLVERIRDNWRARELPDEELEEHLKAIGSVEQYLSEFPAGKVTQEPPPPPKP